MQNSTIDKSLSSNKLNLEQEIELVYPPLPNGERVVSFTQAVRSEHGLVPRDTFYSNPKSMFKAVNSQVAGYFKARVSQDDKFIFKILGGVHSTSNAKAGGCYEVGLRINVNGTCGGHLAKEISHPGITKFLSKIRYLGERDLPNINDKTVGYRLTSYVTSQKTLKGRLDLDLSAMDREPSEFITCPNQFQPYFEFEDDGSWEGAPFTENNGEKYGGRPMGMKVQIDSVTYHTKSKFLQCIEIIPSDD